MIGESLYRLFEVVIGLLYPAYASFKALKYGNEEERRQWIVIWIVIGAFLCFSFLADLVLSWLPVYYEAKLLLLVWLVLPKTRGALVLFNNYFLASLEMHEEQIDRAFDEAHSTVKGHATHMINEGTKVFTSQVSNVLNRSSAVITAALINQSLGDLKQRQNENKSEKNEK
eukprot:c33488_g1_i1.p1 GENE.c33488_g1_i1~~c33488_g1_i1.p1  ORF type:complete len:171 (+),score=61.76 c33488_g1_i1:15-527(+)